VTPQLAPSTTPDARGRCPVDPEVISLRGEHDVATAASLAEMLAEPVASGQGDLIVDLSGVAYLDSSLVTVMIRTQELMTPSRSLTLGGCSPMARRVFRLCGAGDLLGPDVTETAEAPVSA